jgi:hypothetical protein
MTQKKQPIVLSRKEESILRKLGKMYEKVESLDAWNVGGAKYRVIGMLNGLTKYIRE